MSKHSTAFVLIHGAGLGRWIWQPVVSKLKTPVLAIDLPAREQSYEARANLGLQDYTEHVLKQITALKADKIVVVAHSLGGVVGVEVAQKLGDKLAGFVGVAAAIPKPNSSFISCLPIPQRWIMGLVMRFSGTKPPKTAIEQGLCNDLEPQQTAEVVTRFTPESKAVYFDRITARVPLGVPTLYIKTTKDKEFGLALLDAMAKNLRADTVAEIDSGHLPMLSRPDELARTLDDFVTKLG